jgi:UDP-N-acetylglucosamine--N-acetylmuramyl-(pentapeptide) pyrophosphoryl-undecaprenol N-acetylglucosamine transferase
MSSGRRFLIVCGGTGGHLAPGVALAERLTRAGHACLLLVSEKSIDRRFSRKYVELDFESVPGVALRWTPLGLARFGFGFIRGFGRAASILGRFRPDATVVFGGFLSPPFVLMSRLRGIFVAVHEANRHPGRALRLLARFAHRAYVPVGVRLAGLRRSELKACGYPLRREIQHLPKEEARRRWGIRNHGKTLVVLGGSQGAMSLNEWVNENLSGLARAGLNVIAVSGPQKGVESKVELKTERGSTVQAWFLPFSDDISLLFSVADLVVSRAGAGAIAELTACLAPSILVPYPHAADFHQDANGRFFEQQGGCLVLDQKDVSAKLCREVLSLIFNDGLLNRMRRNLRALARADVAAEMAADLEEVLEARLETATRPGAGGPGKEVAV